jgi:hypothetical protein
MSADPGGDRGLVGDRRGGWGDRMVYRVTRRPSTKLFISAVVSLPALEM